jgi:hypothetical protein
MRGFVKLRLLVISLSLCTLACKQDAASDGSKQGQDTVIAPGAEPRDTAVADTIAAEVPPPIKDDKTFDSLMRMEVTLPPILDDKAYDTATVNSFTRLADLSKGEMKLVASADLLQRNISDIICRNNVDFGDVLFLMDVTGSMSEDIAEVKEGMEQIIAELRSRKDVRLAIATYRDLQNDSSNWFSFRNFERDYRGAQRYVDSIQVGSGGDLPESVYEAFIESANQHFWRSRTKRVVLIVGDARGKGKVEGGLYDMEDMLRKASESRIKVNFFPLIITPYSAKYRSHDEAPQPETTTSIIERIYPNPSKGEIYLKMAKPGRYHLAIYSMTGLMVEERNIDDDLWMIDMAFHGDGLYVLRVTDENNQFDVAKFVVKH